jgi:hypothetical protein
MEAQYTAGTDMGAVGCRGQQFLMNTSVREHLQQCCLTMHAQGACVVLRGQNAATRLWLAQIR